jgi:hypothetical protein
MKAGVATFDPSLPITPDGIITWARAQTAPPVPAAPDEER